MDLLPTDFNLMPCENYRNGTMSGRCHDINEGGKCKETWTQGGHGLSWDKCAPSMASKAFEETCKASCGACGISYLYQSI